MRLTSKLLWAAGITAIFFAVSFLFLHPIYYSGDDAYLLYLLGGGFGSPPTELLHYNHLMHPLIGWPIKSMFTVFPFINWFTIFLYGAHFISITYILYLLLQKFSFVRAVMIHAVFFLVFETFFLLHVTFTVTAVVAGIAGIAGLIVKSKEDGGWKKFIVPALIVLMGSLFRIHLLIPLFILSLPFVLALIGYSNKIKFTLAAAGLIAVIALLNFGHKAYYQSGIPGWKKAEAYRQVVFEYFNSPIYYGNEPISAYDTKRQWLEYGIFIDKEYLSPSAIKEIGRTVHFTRLRLNAAMKNSFYWLYVESRVFFVSVICMVSLLCWSSAMRYKIAIIASAAGALAMICALIIFLKLPFYMVPSLLGAVIVFSALGTNTDTVFEPRVMSFNWMLLPFLCAGWGVVRAAKIDASNRELNEGFQRMHLEVKNHPSSLFVVTEDFFPIDFISVWDAPAKFPLPNVLFKDHFFNNTDGPILRRFGLRRPDDVWTNSNVLFWGRQMGALKKYNREVKKREINFSYPLPAFKDAEVRRVLR
ncbi:MAG: hypothetical protein H7Y27_09525 [Gemmatimonadaceae bacterium]|nr:hypothetical protein [Chitinophagaceae bacterium]